MVPFRPRKRETMQHALSATGLTLLGLGMLRLARHSSRPSLLWLGAATSFIGAVRTLRNGRASEHTAKFRHIEI
jgi:hypothetical protein